MKAKIEQKCTTTQSEEGFLTKCFKFFDIHNKGQVNFEQFFRAVEKIGVVIDKNVLVHTYLTHLFRTSRRSSPTTTRMAMKKLTTRSFLLSSAGTQTAALHQWLLSRTTEAITDHRPSPLNRLLKSLSRSSEIR